MAPPDDHDDPLVEDEHDPADPAWFPGQHLPGDARRIGLTHHVPDGALLDFAGSLDASKPYHRFTAWAMLVVFGLPAVLILLQLLRGL